MLNGKWAALRLILGVGVSGGALFLLLRNVAWDVAWTALIRADYFLLLLSFVILLSSVWLKVLRWHALLSPVGDLSCTNLGYSIVVGYLVNNLLPGRLGEFARVYLIARLEPVSLVTGLSTILVERVLDIVVVALALAVVLPSANLPPWAVDSGLAVGAASFLLLALCVVLAYPRGQELFLKGFRAVPKLAGVRVIEHWIESLCLGVRGLQGAKAQTRVALSSLIIWLGTSLSFYLGLLAFHIDAKPFEAALLVTATTTLGMVIPSSPGYVGVYHYMAVLALGAYGIDREVALAYAIVMHLMAVVPLSALGALSLWKCGLTLASLSGREKMAPTCQVETEVA